MRAPGLVQLLHAHNFAGQDHALEDAVEHDLNLDIVRTTRAICPFRRQSAPGPHMGREV